MSNFSHFSQHLFWDVDPESLDWDTHAGFIIGRVLEYGTLADWHVLKQHYGLKQIGEQAIQLRSLNKRAASFVAALTHIPKDTFACYSTKQLTSRHWIS